MRTFLTVLSCVAWMTACKARQDHASIPNTTPSSQNADSSSQPESVAAKDVETAAATVNMGSGTSWTALTESGSFTATAPTADRPQSKIWSYNNVFYTVMPKSDGMYVHRLEGDEWKPLLKISSQTVGYADVLVADKLVHILIYVGNISYLVNLEVDPVNGYRLWTAQPKVQSITLDRGVEVATLVKDTANRLWIVSDVNSIIVARHAAAPFIKWSTPIVLAQGVSTTDISTVVALPELKSIGVFWSNQTKKRFGFRIHVDTDPVSTWKGPEIPADASALNIGNGMADAQFHLTALKDGTVLAAVKTKYGTFPQTQIGLLVRRPEGTWDPKLYPIDVKGTNPVVNFATDTGTVRVLYTSGRTSGDILFSEATLSSLTFSKPRVALQGPWTFPSVSKDPAFNDMVAIATNGSTVGSVRMLSRKPASDPIFVAIIPGETPEDTTLRLQAALDTATAAQIGIYLQRDGVYDLVRSLRISAPGLLFLKGANATLRKVQGTDSVLIVGVELPGFRRAVLYAA